MNRQVVAVVLAAGSGSRFGGELPKQFLPYDGRTLVERSIDAFQSSPLVDKVAVVVAPAYRQHMQSIVQGNDWSKLCGIIDGGAERYLSSVNALKSFDGQSNDDVILLHDAARPFVSQQVIANVVQKLETYQAAAAGIPATDTLWLTSSCGDVVIQSIPDRRCCYQAQTPQGFRFGVLRRAYSMALQDACIVATDDCGILKRYLPEVTIAIAEGDYANKKITFATDI